MEEKKFKVGSYVKFKTYEELVEEFGLMDPEETNGMEVVNCTFGATKELISNYDRKCYIIDTISDNFGFVTFKNYEMVGYVSTDMLIELSEDEKKELILWDSHEGSVSHRFEAYLSNNNVDCRVSNFDDIRIKRTPELTFREVEELFSTLLIPCITDDDYEKPSMLNITGVLNDDSVNGVNLSLRVGLNFNSSNIVIIEKNEEHTSTSIVDICKLYLKQNYNFNLTNYRKIDSSDHFHEIIQFRVPEIDNCVFYLMFVDRIIPNTFVNIYSFFRDFCKLSIPDDCLKYLKEKNKLQFFNTFNNYIDNILDKIDKIAMSKNFLTFAKKTTKNKIEVVNRQVERYKREVESYNSALRDLIRKLHDNEEKLFALKYMKDLSKEENEILQMLKSNIDDFIRFEIHSNTVHVCLKQDLLLWDEEGYESVKEYNTLSDNLYDSRLQKLLQEIFEDRTVTLFFTQGFYFNTVDTDFGRYTFEYYGMPNPHMEAYDCWGDNKSLITQCLEYGDFIGALCQIRSAISGLNMYDPDVLRKFTEYISDFRDKKCLRLEDGSVITIEEWLESNKGDE